MANIVVAIGLALILAGVTIASPPAGLALALIMAIVGGICLAGAGDGAPEERGP
jgi:hypothetical protein